MGSWSRDGVIIFGASAQGPLRRVSASGGVATDITAVNSQRGEAFHSSPIFLPDGRHFLYLLGGSPEVNGIYVGSLDAKPEEQKRERLLATRFSVGYTPSQDSAGGRLFFMRDTTLMAQPFDAGRLQLTGEPIAVAEQLGTSGFHGFFSVSPSGALAYRTGASGSRLPTHLVRPAGKDPGDVRRPQARPGRCPLRGRSAGSGPRYFTTANGDLWTLDFARGVRTRFTFRQTNGSSPIWSSDGSRIAFAAGNTMDTLYEKASSGAGDEKELLKNRERSSFPAVGRTTGAFCCITPPMFPKRGKIYGCFRWKGIASRFFYWEPSSTNARGASPPICDGSPTPLVSPAGPKSMSARSWLRDLPERLRSGRESGRSRRTAERWRSGVPTAKS